MADGEHHHEAGPAHALERLVFFSDAVFAIAITLLVIELHAPHLHRGASNIEYWAALAQLFPEFVGFFISFFVIGSFWAGHHRAFSCAQHWSPRLFFPNLSMLCAIAAMPFFTAFISTNPQARVPAALYCAWLIATAFLNIRLQRVATSRPVVSDAASPEMIRGIRRRGLAVLLGAVTGFVVSLYAPVFGTPALMSIPLWRILISWLDRRGTITAD